MIGGIGSSGAEIIRRARAQPAIMITEPLNAEVWHMTRLWM